MVFARSRRSGNHRLISGYFSREAPLWLRGKLTVTPAQMAAPVQLEALPVAVRRAVGESVTRQEIWSPRAALGQSLRLIQLLTLRTLLCSRGGHANISRI